MDDHSMPGAYVLYSVELVKRWGITAETFLEGSGFDVAALSDLRTRVPLRTILMLLERAVTLTGEPTYGYYLGLQMRVSAHGMLGIAALSAPTLRKSTELTVRFAPMLTTALKLRAEIAGEEASLVFEESADFGKARESLLLAALIGCWQISLATTGRDLGGRAELALPKPPHYERILLVGQGRLRYGMPRHRLVFDASLIDQPLTQADPVVLELARQQCERILASRGPKATVTERVRSLVIQARGRPIALERIAGAIGMSPRTVKRQLAAEGTSFSTLVDDERREQAMILVRSSGSSLKDVAARVGYANLANFTRAFQRWTGKTPSEHRSTTGPAAALAGRALRSRGPAG
jgi:AraC-like DNA-binding protein